MSAIIETYRVFVASPGGLESFREEFAAVLHEYGQREGIPRGVLFQPVGWEETLPGRGRPQEQINADLRKCDYAVFLFRDRWGSAPGGAGTYSSGSEEEWAVANELFARGSMKQLALFFLPVPAPQLRDPGKDLTKLLEFRSGIEQKREHLFKQLQEDSKEEFARELQRLLGQWLRDHEDRSGHAAEDDPDRERAIEIREILADVAGRLLDLTRAIIGGGPLFAAVAALEHELQALLRGVPPSERAAVLANEELTARAATVAWRAPGAADLATQLSELAIRGGSARFRGDWQILSIPIRLLSGINADTFSAHMFTRLFSPEARALRDSSTLETQSVEDLCKELTQSVQSNIAHYFQVRYADAVTHLGNFVAEFTSAVTKLPDQAIVAHSFATRATADTYTGEMLAILQRFERDFDNETHHRLVSVVRSLDVSIRKETAKAKLEGEQGEPSADEERRALVQSMFECLERAGIADPQVELFLGVFHGDTARVKLALARGASTSTTDGDVLARYQSVVASECPKLYAAYWIDKRGG